MNEYVLIGGWCWAVGEVSPLVPFLCEPANNHLVPFRHNRAHRIARIPINPH